MAFMFTDTDVETYKAALARYAAKENCLVEKWTKRLDTVCKCISEIEKFSYPSEADKDSLRSLEKTRNVYFEFLTDIKTPCDSFITDYEWSKVK